MQGKFVCFCRYIFGEKERFVIGLDQNLTQLTVKDIWIGSCPTVLKQRRNAQC